MINSQLFPNADEAVGRTNTAQGHAGKSYPGKYPVSAQNQAMNKHASASTSSALAAQYVPLGLSAQPFRSFLISTWSG